MENQEFSNEELISILHKDVVCWKLNLEFAETKILFINRLLNSSAFKQQIPNLFERLEQFKLQIRTETSALENLKEDVNNYESKIQNLAECEHLFCDADYLKNLDILKTQFEQFSKTLGDLSSKIFNYTGAILKNT